MTGLTAADLQVGTFSEHMNGRRPHDGQPVALPPRERLPCCHGHLAAHAGSCGCMQACPGAPPCAHRQQHAAVPAVLTAVCVHARAGRPPRGGGTRRWRWRGCWRRAMAWCWWGTRCITTCARCGWTTSQSLTPPSSSPIGCALPACIHALCTLWDAWQACPSSLRQHTQWLGCSAM